MLTKSAMRAAFLTGHGGNDVMRVGERPAPGQALMRVRAATVNRVDLYMRDSGAGITHQLPMIMGLDATAIVEEAPASETRLKIGDRVVLHPAVGCGRCEFCLRGDHVLCTAIKYFGEPSDGSFAQFVAASAQNLFPAPPDFSEQEAAALEVIHLTAWRMLFTKTRLQPWESVRILGVGGACPLRRCRWPRPLARARSSRRAVATSSIAPFNGMPTRPSKQGPPICAAFLFGNCG